MPKKQTQIIGLKDLFKGLDKKQKEHEQGFHIGVRKAGLWLLRESMKLVPVDTGALRASGPLVTRSMGQGFETVMVVGYGQEYAIYVHENLNARHASGKQAKFLEEPARTGRQTMTDIIRDEMRRA